MWFQTPDSQFYITCTSILATDEQSGRGQTTAMCVYQECPFFSLPAARVPVFVFFQLGKIVCVISISVLHTLFFQGREFNIIFSFVMA